MKPTLPDVMTSKQGLKALCHVSAICFMSICALWIKHLNLIAKFRLCTISRKTYTLGRNQNQTGIVETGIERSVSGFCYMFHVNICSGALWIKHRNLIAKFGLSTMSRKTYSLGRNHNQTGIERTVSCFCYMFHVNMCLCTMD